MTLHIGEDNIVDIRYSDQKVARVYKGSDLVWGYAPGEIIFESDTPGTYNLYIKCRCKISIVLVGGGGGAAYCIDDFGYHGGKRGGSGSVVTGTISVPAGNYVVNVSQFGPGKTQRETTVSAADATPSSFGGISAGGGGGAKNVFHDAYNDRGTPGLGGKYNIPSQYSSTLTGTNGVQGSTASTYGSYGGGGAISNNQAQDGQHGYVKIVAI